MIYGPSIFRTICGRISDCLPVSPSQATTERKEYRTQTIDQDCAGLILWCTTFRREIFIFLEALEVRSTFPELMVSSCYGPTERNTHLLLLKDFILNDLWRFDLNSNMWTWLSGTWSDTFILGKYGTKGQASSANIPGSRLDHSMAMDSTNQILYLFGGRGNAIDPTPGNGLL